MRIAILSTAIVAGMAIKAGGDPVAHYISGFDKVAVQTDATVTISEGGEFSVKVEGSKRALRRFIVRKQRDTLVVKRRHAWSLIGYLADGPVSVTISMPDLEALEAQAKSQLEVQADAGPLEVEISSGAQVALTGPVADLEVEVRSGAGFTATGLVADTVEARARSGGSIRLSGTCTTLEADSASGASLRAGGLLCQEVEADVASGGRLEVHALAQIKGEARSGASLLVGGDPIDRDLESASGGSIRLQ